MRPSLNYVTIQLWEDVRRLTQDSLSWCIEARIKIKVCFCAPNVFELDFDPSPTATVLIISMNGRSQKHCIQNTKCCHFKEGKWYKLEIYLQTSYWIQRRQWSHRCGDHGGQNVWFSSIIFTIYPRLAKLLRYPQIRLPSECYHPPSTLQSVPNFRHAVPTKHPLQPFFPLTPPNPPPCGWGWHADEEPSCHSNRRQLLWRLMGRRAREETMDVWQGRGCCDGLPLS